MDNDRKVEVKSLRKAFLWWFIRILPFVILYLFVKIAFFAGYFDVFGSQEVQLIAHEFFIKILITICIFISFIAFKRYFLVFFEDSFHSLIDRYFRSSKRKNEIVGVFSKIVLYSVLFITFLIILNLWFESKIKWFTDLFTSTSVLFLSFVAGLFTSSILGNIIAYEILVKSKEFKVGNRVKIGNVYGDIESIGFFFTHIRTIDNEMINIPNLIVLTKGVKNYSTLKEILISIPVFLPYSVDVERAKDLLLESAVKTKGIIKSEDKTPMVWCEELGENSAKYLVRVFIDDPKKREQIKSELIENILEETEKRKIKMPLPRRMKYDKIGKD